MDDNIPIEDEPQAVWKSGRDPIYCLHEWKVISKIRRIVFGNPGSYIEVTKKCTKCGKIETHAQTGAW